eukprot:TRINITY_DN57478_c0_g1_i1.p1 TRINITY_DN57478_c0_g1~~TRINITY_DN57478_c0_g1_i1.p1  ORF type:complete len:358 (-),score=33.69 TRINITY_DN57478_c0_g1_i1:224-1219(-)
MAPQPRRPQCPAFAWEDFERSPGVQVETREDVSPPPSPKVTKPSAKERMHPQPRPRIPPLDRADDNQKTSPRASPGNAAQPQFAGTSGRRQSLPEFPRRISSSSPRAQARQEENCSRRLSHGSALRGRSLLGQSKAVKLPTKYIFLDVDGVLHSAHFAKHPFNDDCMIELSRIIRDTGASIVLSSTWRLNKIQHAAVDRTLLRYGIPKTIGATPQLKGPANGRASEILEWLSQNTADRHVSWIAIDDMDMPLLGDKLILTDKDDGLTRYDARLAITELNGLPELATFSSDSSFAGSDEEEAEETVDDVLATSPGVQSRVSRCSTISIATAR